MPGMVTDIITDLGGPAAVARALSLPSYSTPLSWGRRGSIPVRYWAPLIAVAADKGRALTVEQLHAAHAEARA